MEHKYCCNEMKYYAFTSFKFDEYSENNVIEPNKIIYYNSKFDEYGIAINDGGASSIQISYCPWCGHCLPESKRDRWFSTLEELGTDPYDKKSIPEAFQSGKWYSGD